MKSGLEWTNLLVVNDADIPAPLAVGIDALAVQGLIVEPATDDVVVHGCWCQSQSKLLRHVGGVACDQRNAGHGQNNKVDANFMVLNEIANKQVSCWDQQLKKKYRIDAPQFETVVTSLTHLMRFPTLSFVTIHDSYQPNGTRLSDGDNGLAAGETQLGHVVRRTVAHRLIPLFVTVFGRWFALGFSGETDQHAFGSPEPICRFVALLSLRVRLLVNGLMCSVVV